MAVKPPNEISAMSQLETALDGPVAQRCSLVEKILNDFSPKELHGALPLLVESLFNFNSHPQSWWIHRVSGSSASDQDFRGLRNLLSPQGSLLQVIYKLTSDSACKYEFPIWCLPFPSQCMIEEGNIPPFYLYKIQFNHSGKAFRCLLLNAFEYYMFHFAYFIVNLQISKASSRTDIQASNIYAVLVEDYLNSFFPLDSSSNPPFVQHASITPRNLLQPILEQSSSGNLRLTSVQMPLHLSSSFGKTSPSIFPGLFKVDPQVVMPLTPVMNSDLGWGEKETWLSEELLQILVEFWLNQTVGSEQHCLHTNTVTSFSVEHIRLVRVMVKHLHFFVNTFRHPIQSTYRTPLVARRDEFKGLVWPQYVQKKLYRFLRHNFEWWPLDASFKVVLETWLSFIQPWRYCDHHLPPGKDQDVENKDVEDKWRPFVSDHLLFYTVLFHSFLERALRMELSSYKNAYMLFRVSKILSLPNLNNILSDAESMMHDPFDRFARPVSNHSTDSVMNSSYRSVNSPMTNFALQFSDLEGVRFQYRPLLGLNTQQTVEQLLKMTQSALETARTESDLSECSSKSWLSWLGFNYLMNHDYNVTRYYSSDSIDDINSGFESKKTVNYLEQAILNLCAFFKVNQPSSPAHLSGIASKKLQHTTHQEFPDIETTTSGVTLTPLGRYQIINGLRKFDVGYQGNPDLQPIRSYECAFLVRFLYSISCFLNSRFASQMSLVYNRDDFVGLVTQQLLHPPQEGFSPIQISRLSPAAQKQLASNNQPHLSLRWLASYIALGYLLLFCLLLKVVSNMSMANCFIILVILCLFFLMVKALFNRY